MKVIKYTPVDQWLIGTGLDELERHIDQMEGLFKGEKKRLKERFERQLASCSAGEGEGYFEQYLEDDISDGLHWYGTMVTIWAFFERSMLGTCRRDLHRRAKALETIGEVRLSGVKDAKEYWKSQGIIIPGGSLWEQIMYYCHVRDQIAHDSGLLNNNRFADARAIRRSEQIEGYITTRMNQEKTGISLKDKALVLTAHYCREAVATMKAFFAAFFKTRRQLQVTP